jgi:plasmid stabilization system protein ParE
MVNLKVVWSKNGSIQLRESLKDLKKKSPKSALKVKNEILKTSRELSKNPEIYGLDRFKKDNDGSIRSFEKYSYRIIYQVENTQVVILRVRHTSREPLKH